MIKKSGGCDMDYKILSNLIITDIISAHPLYSEENVRSKQSSRSCWAIIIKYEGETVYAVGNEKFISNINNIIMLPKGLTYEWQCTKAGDFFVLNFEANITHNKILTFPTSSGEKILRALKSIESKRNTKRPMYIPECIKGTYDIILALVGSPNQKYMPSNKAAKIQPAIDYIRKNYSSSIKNDELASMCQLSTVYFRKLFTECFGMSPITYLHTLRIKKAKEMLKSDYSTITTIAHALGYSNIYDFSRTFKKYTGMAPRDSAK